MILGSLFQDGAVLQRGKLLPVWGKTVPDALVKAVLNGNEAFCRSGADGNFMLYFPPQSAGGPFEMHVEVPACAGESVTIRDLLIGEVFLASGQSNMEYELQPSRETIGDSVKSTETARRQEQEFYASVADPEHFRFFSVERCANGAAEKSAGGSWHRMSAAEAAHASAVAAWCGMYLQKAMPEIPIGLVVSSWGGTTAEAWTSVNALMLNPATRAAVTKRFECSKYEFCAIPGESVFDLKKCTDIKCDPGISAEALSWSQPGFDDSAWQDIGIPGSWIRQEIAGNGAVWIRKEVDLPADWAGCDLVLHAGCIDKHDITFVNGVEVGRTGSGLETEHYNMHRAYPVPAALVTGNKLTIAVRGFSFIMDGSFLGSWSLKRASDGAEISLEGFWKAHAEFDWGKFNMQKYTKPGSGNPKAPGILFDGMIRPLTPYAFRGVLWYQGESNAEFHADYLGVMQNLLNDWRYRFRDPELPWFSVQLAGYGPAKNFIAWDDWAFLREAQRLLCERDANSFMVTAVDLGEMLDIHPQDKKNVGFRLAQSVLHHLFGKTDILPGGPEICSAHLESDGSAMLKFRYADGMTIDPDKPQSFYVSADGKNFQPAERATVVGDCVNISAPAGVKIAEVRYCWSAFPPVTLYNAAGIPASPFRIQLEP